METLLEAERKSNTSNSLSQEGKYLTFILCNEEYGLEILKVREIIGIMPITPIPQSPNYLKGVINLRGKVIPVVDLRTKFGFQEAEWTKESCIIVVEIHAVLTGIIVDTVSEVIDIREEEFEPSPHLGSDVDMEIFLGMAKIKDKVKILLDIDKILNMKGIAALEGLSMVISDDQEGRNN